MESQDVEKLRLLELIGSTLTGEAAREQAEQLVGAITDERLRRYAESRLASLLVEIGELKAAEEIATHMAQTARHSPAAFVLAKLAEKLAIQDQAGALHCLQRAEDAARADADVYTRSVTQERIVRAYASLAQWDHAQRLSREIEVVSDKVAAICALAEKMAAAGQRSLALDLAARAAIVAGTSQKEQAELLDEVARTYLNLGERDKAHGTWINSASSALGASHDTSQLLLGICMALMSLGDQPRARELALAITNHARREQALAVTVKDAVIGK
jgi:hypothetical protein